MKCIQKRYIILIHRIFIARRKQGGSQSANDNANGKAKSAGAQIRRHNETALTDVNILSILCRVCSRSHFYC